MLDFLETYGVDILAAIVALCAAITSLCGTIKMFKSEKRIKADKAQIREDIAVTREGIVQAFKQAKIPTDIKVDISKQVYKILNEFEEKILEMFREQEQIRTGLVLFCTKIMANTAAYNKLTDTEKEALEQLMKQINEQDKIVEIEPETKAED